MMKVDGYLTDEKLYRMMRKDLSQRYSKTCQKSRNSALVEEVLGRLVLKWL